MGRDKCVRDILAAWHPYVDNLVDPVYGELTHQQRVLGRQS